MMLSSGVVVVREKKQRAAKPRLRSSLLPPANAVPGTQGGRGKNTREAAGFAGALTTSPLSRGV